MADIFDDTTPAVSPAASQQDPFAAGSPADNNSAPAELPARGGSVDSMQSLGAGSSVAGGGLKGKGPSAEDAMKASEAAVFAAGEAKAKAEAKAIDERKADSDKRNKGGVESMRKEASAHHDDDKTRRASHIATAKKAHREEQKVREERINKLQRGGTVWEQAGELIDTGKPNKFATKNTDRMRALLTQLKATPNAKEMHAGSA